MWVWVQYFIRKDNNFCFEYLNTQSLIAVMLEWPAWFNWITKELGLEILSVMVTLKSWVLTLRDMSRNSFYITSTLWQRVKFHCSTDFTKSVKKERDFSHGFILYCHRFIVLCLTRFCEKLLCNILNNYYNINKRKWNGREHFVANFINTFKKGSQTIKYVV